jgi:hypothetical protein
MTAAWQDRSLLTAATSPSQYQYMMHYKLYLYLPNPIMVTLLRLLPPFLLLVILDLSTGFRSFSWCHPPWCAFLAPMAHMLLAAKMSHLMTHLPNITVLFV